MASEYSESVSMNLNVADASDLDQDLADFAIEEKNNPEFPNGNTDIVINPERKIFSQSISDDQTRSPVDIDTNSKIGEENPEKQNDELEDDNHLAPRPIPMARKSRSQTSSSRKSLENINQTKEGLSDRSSKSDSSKNATPIKEKSIESSSGSGGVILKPTFDDSRISKDLSQESVKNFKNDTFDETVVTSENDVLSKNATPIKEKSTESSAKSDEVMLKPTFIEDRISKDSSRASVKDSKNEAVDETVVPSENNDLSKIATPISEISIESPVKTDEVMLKPTSNESRISKDSSRASEKDLKNDAVDETVVTSENNDLSKNTTQIKEKSTESSDKSDKVMLEPTFNEGRISKNSSRESVKNFKNVAVDETVVTPENDDLSINATPIKEKSTESSTKSDEVMLEPTNNEGRISKDASPTSVKNFKNDAVDGTVVTLENNDLSKNATPINEIFIDSSVKSDEVMLEPTFNEGRISKDLSRASVKNLKNDAVDGTVVILENNDSSKNATPIEEISIESPVKSDEDVLKPTFDESKILKNPSLASTEDLKNDVADENVVTPENNSPQTAPWNANVDRASLSMPQSNEKSQRLLDKRKSYFRAGYANKIAAINYKIFKESKKGDRACNFKHSSRCLLTELSSSTYSACADSKCLYRRCKSLESYRGTGQFSLSRRTYQQSNKISQLAKSLKMLRSCKK